MEFLKKKKKILYAGCVFFVIMFCARCYQRGFTERVCRRWRRKSRKKGRSAIWWRRKVW